MPRKFANFPILVRGMRLISEICRDTENISSRKHTDRARAIFLHLVEYVPEDYDIHITLFSL